MMDKHCLYRHWKARHFETHGAYGEWAKAQQESSKASSFSVADIVSGWDGLDSDFDEYSDDDESSYGIKSELFCEATLKEEDLN